MSRGTHGNHATADNAGRWNRGQLVSSQGYRLIRVGKSHPLADPNGYVYEHKLIVVAAFGSKAIEGAVIHHKNGCRSDNRLENLEILSRSEHNKTHNKARQRDENGRFLPGREWNESPATEGQ